MTASILSLCSGYGGLDLAVERVVGGETRWCAEIDRDAITVLAARFPDAEQLGDLTTYDWTCLAGQVDIITAGYPCQPFSVAGRRRGEDDARHIWPDVLRAVCVLRPGLVVLENVRGHLALGFDSVLADLAGIGMDARWAVVRASDVGAPHRRARLFVVAYPHGAPADAHAATGAPRGAARQRGGVAAHAEGEYGRERQLERMGAGGRPAELRKCDRGSRTPTDTDGFESQRRNRVDGRTGVWIETAAQPRHGSERAATDPEGERRCSRTGLPDAPERPGPATGCEIDWQRFGPAIRGWGRILGRPAPAPLVTGGKQLSAEFVEWMMGLPDGWVTDLVPNRRALKTLGNGVVPQQAELALRMLLT